MWFSMRRQRTHVDQPHLHRRHAGGAQRGILGDRVILAVAARAGDELRGRRPVFIQPPVCAVVRGGNAIGQCIDGGQQRIRYRGIACADRLLVALPARQAQA